MRSINVTLVLALVLSIGAPAVAADIDYPLIGQSPVYTLVNLHPDEPRQRLYSVNYQQQGLIPLCTKVKLESLDKRKLTFRVLGKDREYEYVFHNSLREPIPKHLDRYFGKKCEPKLESLSDVDRKGVQSGSVTPGVVRPKPLLNLAGATALGLVLGILAAMLRVRRTRPTVGRAMRQRLSQVHSERRRHRFCGVVPSAPQPGHAVTLGENDRRPSACSSSQAV